MDRKLYRNMAMMIAMFILAFGVGAASAQQAAKAKADNSGAADGAANGQQVAVDGKGHFRALSNEEAAALAAQMVKENNSSSEGLRTFTAANGWIGVDLDGRFENSEVVKVNPDGTLSQACVHTQDEAKKFLTSAPESKPTAQPELETK